MVVSEGTKGDDGLPVDQPLTWRCPEGHVFRFRRRPLLSSCIFIFCFLIMERAAMFAFRSFLYRYVGKALGGGYKDPSFTYMWIAIFFGVYDVSPILLAVVSDTYLGCFKAIAVFGFTFVFGLTLSVLSNSLAGGRDYLPPVWLNAISLLIVAISSGGLTQLLVAFGGGQFHPKGQTSSGSRFFSMIYVMAGVGAIIGILTTAFVWNGGNGLFYTVLLSAAIMAMAGWICFLSGTWLYVDRCIHPSSTLRVFSLAWDCLKQRSFQKGGDLRLVARLVPIFLLLLPLYSGQLQSLTTLRDMEKHMDAPRSGSSIFCFELLLIAEPVTVIFFTLLLNEVIFPLLRRRSGWMITHLTRFTIAAGLIATGFIVCLLLQLKLVDSFESNAQKRPSVYLTLIPIVLFALGQLLVTSSGLELSWSHAPSSLRSVSVALFSSIYALGSWISLGLFGAFQSLYENPVGATSLVENKPTRGTLEYYYATCAGLAGLSLVGLLCMRGFYQRTRQMKIERDVEQRAIEIALARLSSAA